MRRAILALALLLAVPTSAQNSATAEPTAQQRALAAGYVALTVCSAINNGPARPIEHVRANELVGVYPELDPVIGTMTPEIERWQVSVDWDASSPPRIARYRPGAGCAILPTGLPVDEAAMLLPPPQMVRIRRQAPWPRGDDDFLRTAAEGRAPTPDHARPALFDVRNRAFNGLYGEGTNTTAVVVVRGEEIVSERYARGFDTGTPQRTWSVAKSLAITIIGAAVQRGEVDVNAPAAIPQWQADGDPRRAITLDNLMRMASGLTSDTAGNRTDGIYFGGVAVDEQAPGWPLIAPPGSTFRYANNDTLLATLAIATTFARHSPHDFFASVDMQSTIAETDWRGNYVLSSQVWATARDLARFGMLYLNNGVWQGERILPENWRTYVTTPSGPQPEGMFGYGAGFWLMNRIDGIPPDTFAAFGNRGQFVVIVPSRNIVIVRRGEDPAGTSFAIAAFTRDVLAALR